MKFVSFCGGVGGGGGCVVVVGKIELMEDAVGGYVGEGEKHGGGSPGHGGVFFSIEISRIFTM